MKTKFYPFALMLILVLSCKSGTKEITVNSDTEKAAITAILEKQFEALNAKNANPYLALLTDDVLVCGTDPKEFWDKTTVSQMFTNIIGNPSLNINFNVEKREIRLSGDGNSAIVIEQMIADFISPKIPIRRIYHFVRNNDAWQIDFDCTSLVPLNEDLPKLNKALE